MKKLNIACENIYKEKTSVNVTDIANKIFNFYMTCPDISENCCTQGYNYKSITFDFLLCNGEKTHEINREYRGKDYPADIITFAVFADSQEDERFVLDGDINLGEIIIALDKIEESAKEKNISKEDELIFFISHGILHLLGFDHQTQDDYNFVIDFQKKALESVNIFYDKV